MSQWIRRAGENLPPGVVTNVSPGDATWNHTGLLVVDLAAGEGRDVTTGHTEAIVVPLSGSFAVQIGDDRHDLTGRAHVFAGPTDVLYLPRDTEATVSSDQGGRVAICSAVCTTGDTFPVTHLDRDDVPVELRGAGQASREVRNFGIPGVLEADSIIACEVITPAGNWSSWPPHKHDEEVPGEQTNLEEIYWFALQREGGDQDDRAEHGGSRGSSPSDGVGYQRVYGTDERPIDVLAEVSTGDTVLVPHGWHGPAMAPTGYDMYYLNVMAGPGRTRAWLIVDDPTHAWIRGTWADQAVDPRLPLNS